MPRSSPELPTTDAEWQAATRELRGAPGARPTSDAEWQAAMRSMGLSDMVTPKRPLTNAEWQAGFARFV